MVEHSIEKDIMEKKSLIKNALLSTVRSKLVVGKVPDSTGSIPRFIIELISAGVSGVVSLSFAFAQGKFVKKDGKWVFDLGAGVEGISDTKVIREYLNKLLSKEYYLSLPSPRKGHYRVNKIMKSVTKLIESYVYGRPEILFSARLIPKKPLFEAKYNLQVKIGIPDKELQNLLGVEESTIEFTFPVNEIPNDDSEFQRFREFVDKVYYWVYPVRVSSSHGLYTTVWRGKQVYYKKTTSKQSVIITYLVRFREGKFSRYELRILNELQSVDRFDYDKKIEILKKLLGNEWEVFLEYLVNSIDEVYLRYQSHRAFPRYLLEKEGVLGHEEKGIIYAE